MTTWNFGVVYEHCIQLFCIAVSFVWCIFLIKGKGWGEYKFWKIIFAILLFVCLGLYMENAWHVGYITNTPLIGINAEMNGIFRDTLYHNAIASSIEYYGYPSLLVNSSAFHDYHFGSHMILGLISKMMKMPTIFTYCYLYPVIFFPLYVSLILSVGADIRSRVNKDQKIGLSDIVVLMGFLTFYILPVEISNTLGDGHSTSFLISESYCVAIVLGLLFFKIWLQVSNRKWLDNKHFAVFFALVVVPFFIVATGVSKISVGLIFTFVVCYYLFRTKRLDLKFFLLEIYYVAVIMAVHYIPAGIYSPILSGSTEKVYNIQFLAYLRNNFTPTMWGMHIFSLFLYAFIFIVYEMRKVGFAKEFLAGLKERKFVTEETLFLACIISAIPGLFIDIGGGSAYYFFTIQQVIATTLLIGYRIPSEIVEWIICVINKRYMYKLACLFIIICFSFNGIGLSISYIITLARDCHLSSVQYAESIKEGSYWETIKNINNLTQDDKENYYIYVCSSAAIWGKYANPDSAIFFYPAMTGIVCIGELYFQDGQLYTNNDVLKEGGYTYKPLIEDQKMTYEDAYLKAKEDGKKAIIYIYDNTYSVREVAE